MADGRGVGGSAVSQPWRLIGGEWEGALVVSIEEENGREHW